MQGFVSRSGVRHGRSGSGRLSGWIGALAVGLAGSVIFAASEAAAVDSSRNRRTVTVKREPVPKQSMPLLAVISLANQHVNFYGANGHLLTSRVSTGQAGHLTPTGVFSVIQKQRYHESNIYSGAPMPYMQRITWSGVAMHEGVVPNYPASHGCIRMPGSFASQLFPLTKVGMRVLISPTDVTPHEVSHPSLFVPRPVRSEAVAAGAGIVQVANSGNTTGPIVPFDPLKAAEALKVAAAQRVAEANKAVAAAIAQSQGMSAEANRAMEALRTAEGARSAADAKLAAAQRGVDQATSEEAREAAKTVLATAEVSASQTSKELDRVKAEEGSKSDAAFAMVAAYKTAEANKAAAEAAAKDAQRRTEPISVFVSRKEGRLFVRQAFEPVLDVPIEIKNSDQPLGTHVFTAMAIKDGGSGVHWVAVTIPTSGMIEPDKRKSKSRNREREDTSKIVTASISRPSSATQALDRIEMPKEAVERISELLLPGASLIVSDFGISQETGKGTDFVVLTR